MRLRWSRSISRSANFSVHYAGFFDPGFGYGAGGEIKGTKAVLEVRAHEVSYLARRWKQIIGRLIYHRMAAAPEKLYGQAIGSSYQQQGLALSKQFKPVESARLRGAEVLNLESPTKEKRPQFPTGPLRFSDFPDT